MRLKILSDLHTEFGNEFMLPYFLEGDMDIVIIAGDLGNSSNLLTVLEELDNITKVPVIYVPGNHDYYGATKEKVDKDLTRDYKNIVILNNNTAVINDLVFIGSTGWWESGITSDHKRYLNDFNSIYDIAEAKDGIVWGKQSRTFFEKELAMYEGRKIVCISHNMPSYLCISKLYEGHFLNNCFANDWDTLIKKYKPSLWVCGHTHNSFDLYIENTRVICNPFGYYMYDTNPQYNNNLIVEVAS